MPRAKTGRSRQHKRTLAAIGREKGAIARTEQTLLQRLRQPAQEGRALPIVVPIPRPRPDFAAVLTQRILTILLTRADALRLNEDIAAPTEPKMCVHMTTIGSSLVSKLFQPSSISFQSLHARSYFATARSVGRIWEDKVEKWSELKFLDKTYQIVDFIKEPCRYSLQLPWICATPDFVMELVDSNHANSFLAVVEVKSTTSVNEFNIRLTRHETQVQVALDCFNISHGFLVTFLFDKETNKMVQCAVDLINRSHYLSCNRAVLIQETARFQSLFIEKVTGVAENVSLLADQLAKVVTTAPLPKVADLDTIRKWPKVPSRPRCYFSKRYFRRTNRNPGPKSDVHKHLKLLGADK